MINSISQSYQTNAHYNKVETTKEKNNSNFELINNILNKDPKNITIKEYQQLTWDNINEKYPYDKNASKEAQIQGSQMRALFTAANYSEDPILNEILFKQEKKVFENNPEATTTSIGKAMSSVNLLNGMEEPITFSGNISKMLVTVNNKEQMHSAKFMKENQQEFNFLRTQLKTNQEKPMTFEYFVTLINNLKNGYSNNMTDEAKNSIDKNSTFKQLEEIVNMYDLKRKDNSKALQEYLRG